MANFGAKILGSSVSSMTAQQALIANTSNNIANVNTPGYTRRQIEIESRGDVANIGSILQIGSGVQLGDVKRSTNEFLEYQLRQANSRKGYADIRNDYLSAIETVFALDGPMTTIGSALNSFFGAISQVGVNPSNIDLRINVMQRGEDLISSIKTAYNTVASVQNELNKRVGLEVETINSMTKELAALNGQIGQREASGIGAIDERDQRDTLLAKLASKISFTTLETGNGMINCYLSNGFPLVNQETSRDLTVTASPSFATTTLPRSLAGDVLTYVTYDFGSETAPSHLDLTQLLKNGSGSLAGILQLRGTTDPSNTSPFEAEGELVAVASRIEAITRQLLTTVNQEYLGADESNLLPGFQPSSGDLNGNAPGVFGLFDFDFSGVKDVDGDGIPEVSDLLGTAPSIGNFSSILKLGFTDPSAFAAARDNDATQGSTVFPQGDGQNAEAIAALRSTTFALSLGSFTFSGTLEEAYNATVSYVGNAKSTAQLEVDVAAANLTSTANKRDEFSAVSLDEEFANLIKYQRAFQAAARMIKTAGDLLDQIVSLI
jgi:flagellar hook-associated protein 1 FlgK